MIDREIGVPKMVGERSNSVAIGRGAEATIVTFACAFIRERIFDLKVWCRIRNKVTDTKNRTMTMSTVICVISNNTKYPWGFPTPYMRTNSRASYKTENMTIPIPGILNFRTNWIFRSFFEERSSNQYKRFKNWALVENGIQTVRPTWIGDFPREIVAEKKSKLQACFFFTENF